MQPKARPILPLMQVKSMGASVFTAVILLVSITTLALAASNALIIAATVYDPINDVFGSNPQHDATQFSISADSMYVTLTMNFADGIQPPGAGTDEVHGFIDMDTDQNTTTGKSSHINTYPQCTPTHIGMDYYVDISTYSG